jgi:hypothetical protein
MTRQEIDLLPLPERTLTRASHDYYRALLRGAPEPERRRLCRIWLQEVQQRWPEVLRSSRGNG